jgi:hypothetical protein
MTTKLRAQFDGKTLVPLEPVDLPIGEVLEVEVRETETASHLRKGSPELLLRIMDTLPKLTREDVEALERSIKEGQIPMRYNGVFDEPK